MNNRIFIMAITLLGVSIIVGGVFAMPETKQSTESVNRETATLGGGCFWCLEAIFMEMEGVHSVASGYAGGDNPDPTYQEVCSGSTGHAEVIQVTFDPTITTYRELLAAFFTIHDPTTLNRQGADVGSQYRSAIFTHSSAQEQEAREVITALEKEHVYSSPVVTEVAPFLKFYKAEEYHQDYYQRNRAQGYCRTVIDPKLKKFRQKFAEKRRK
ncbi:MAG: peptide-methionine (S)-S-oxide reductase MsrA [Gemmatimonadales bacterium]|nr:peptide-methionine (S)-S-oxide reductase MsrA [Gemmatimonadales bacterium]